MSNAHLPSPAASPAACRRRRLLWRADLALSVLLALAIFIMINALSSRHYARLHAAADAPPLSAKTLRLLETVTGDIHVSVLLRPSHDATRAVTALLQEYAANSPGFFIEYIDPDRDMARAEEILARYNLPGEECVVFDTGGRHRAVPADSLLDYGLPDTSPDGTPAARIFRGESLFSGAILSLTQVTRPAVYFTQGHGEHSPADFSRRDGFSRIAARLRDENLDVRLLDLANTGAVPADCALLVTAGPRRDFAPAELALLRDYLNRKGRILFLLDARSSAGLEPLLREWGLLLADDVIADASRSLSGRDLHISAYPAHAITAPLQDLSTVFSLPRSIRPAPQTAGGDKPAVSLLLLSSASGWAEFNPDDGAPRFDPRIDIPGPVPLAAAVERGPVPGVHVQIRPTRLVVIGDSDFVSNGGLAGANADLFLNAVNWLLDREDAIAIAPRALDDFRVVLDSSRLRRLFLYVVVAPPALLMILGLWVAWKRRR